jgi:hypothetical protein
LIAVDRMAGEIAALGAGVQTGSRVGLAFSGVVQGGSFLRKEPLD